MGESPFGDVLLQQLEVALPEIGDDLSESISTPIPAPGGETHLATREAADRNNHLSLFGVSRGLSCGLQRVCLGVGCRGVGVSMGQTRGQLKSFWPRCSAKTSAHVEVFPGTGNLLSSTLDGHLQYRPPPRTQKCLQQRQRMLRLRPQSPGNRAVNLAMLLRQNRRRRARPQIMAPLPRRRQRGKDTDTEGRGTKTKTKQERTWSQPRMQETKPPSLQRRKKQVWKENRRRALKTPWPRGPIGSCRPRWADASCSWTRYLLEMKSTASVTLQILGTRMLTPVSPKIYPPCACHVPQNLLHENLPPRPHYPAASS